MDNRMQTGTIINNLKAARKDFPNKQALSKSIATKGPDGL